MEIRFADIELLRYKTPAFDTLSLNDKLYIYHLAKASLYGRDILWDQNCRYNLRIRWMLENILLDSTVSHDDAGWQSFLTYIRQVWFANGIHHHYSTDKFQPSFSREWLLQAWNSIPTEKRTPRLTAGEVSLLTDVITNPAIMPKRVSQKGGDLLQSSACNYYDETVTQHEAEEFYASLKKTAPNPDRPVMYGMNSRLERDDRGKLWENTYRIGGLYDKNIRLIAGELESARTYAQTPLQKKNIDLLLEFYRTGSLDAFDRYTISWIGETQGTIDFVNGFTEVYGDPLDLKASWEGYVNILDTEATHRTQVISQHAQWFEDHSPVDDRFKRRECHGVTARVVQAAILGGDLYPSSAIGINLPNSNWIRSVYGSKSVTIGNLTTAYNQAAKGNGFREEFIPDDDIRSLINRYGDICDDLHTDLHECLGHGSGQMLPGVDADALGVYASTIEEARADLFGLYYIADPKMYQLGLIPTPDAWHANYYTYMLGGIMTQLVRIQPGQDIEEAHMRNRALIGNWCLHNGDAMHLAHTDGKTTLEITDYQTLRRQIGILLAEIQRIKSTGDFPAARNIVETYGVKVDPILHAEMLRRYEALDLAPYKGFINPRYTLVKDRDGNVTDVTVDYTETYDRQMLRYGRQYTAS
ncbi:MAG: dihydrofolate reductase [Bacteroidaceae bacterium]|nr:dihydrofolate reductase [Bacteroidaceae bacterium]